MTEKIFEYPDEVIAEQLGMSIARTACDRSDLDTVFFEDKEQLEAEERLKREEV